MPTTPRMPFRPRFWCWSARRRPFGRARRWRTGCTAWPSGRRWRRSARGPGGAPKRLRRRPAATLPTMGKANELREMLDQELGFVCRPSIARFSSCATWKGKNGRRRPAASAAPKGQCGESSCPEARSGLARCRLARRGLAVSGVALAAALSQQSASACVPLSLAASTVKAAKLLAAGAAAGVVSAEVAALDDGRGAESCRWPSSRSGRPPCWSLGASSPLQRRASSPAITRARPLWMDPREKRSRRLFPRRFARPRCGPKSSWTKRMSRRRNPWPSAGTARRWPRWIARGRSRSGTWPAARIRR